MLKVVQVQMHEPLLEKENSSVHIEMEATPIYPVLTLPQGQFVIVDGFLVNLNAKKSNSSLVEHVETIWEKDSTFLQKYRKFNTLSKMEEIAGNYFLTKHILFFRLMGFKEYVSFVKSRDRYYCRKCDKKRATHVAFPVRLPWTKRRLRVKYVVFDKSLKEFELNISDLYKQQNNDLQKIGSSSLKIMQPYTFETPNCENVKLVSEAELFSMTQTLARNTIVHIECELSARKRKRNTSLNDFRHCLLRHCKQNGLWKLRNMVEFLTANKDSLGISLDTDQLYKECEKSILSNLKLIDQKLFPFLVQCELSRYHGSYPISTSKASKLSSTKTNTKLGTIEEPVEVISKESCSPEKNAISSSSKIDDSGHYFLGRIFFFCSYSEQRKLYIESFTEASAGHSL